MSLSTSPTSYNTVSAPHVPLGHLIELEEAFSSANCLSRLSRPTTPCSTDNKPIFARYADTYGMAGYQNYHYKYVDKAYLRAQDRRPVKERINYEPATETHDKTPPTVMCSMIEALTNNTKSVELDMREYYRQTAYAACHTHNPSAELAETAVTLMTVLELTEPDCKKSLFGTFTKETKSKPDIKNASELENTFRNIMACAENTDKAVYIDAFASEYKRNKTITLPPPEMPIHLPAPTKRVFSTAIKKLHNTSKVIQSDIQPDRTVVNGQQLAHELIKDFTANLRVFAAPHAELRYQRLDPIKPNADFHCAASCR